MLEIYALYPSGERPQYRVDGLEFARPEEHRCACGSAHRLQCKCEAYPINVVANLQREQDGDSRGYGLDQNWQFREEQRQERAPLESERDGLSRARNWWYRREQDTMWSQHGSSDPSHKIRDAAQMKVLKQEEGEVIGLLESLHKRQSERGLPSTFTNWWKGYRSSRGFDGLNTMHLADRLLRAYPGILVNDSARAMALYRHVSAGDLITAYGNQNSDRMLE